MNAVRQRFRQIHLEFHTSPEIPDIAADFDAEAFATRMQRSRVNSVNIAAKCHHGLSYYPTKAGVMHPHLSIDLMGAMIEALHRRDILALPCISVARDERAGWRHPEWLAVLPGGQFAGKKMFDNERPWLEGIEPAGGKERIRQESWRELCLNTPYIDTVLEQAGEILRNYRADGIRFEVVGQPDGGCTCTACVSSMLERGLDPASAADRAAFARDVTRRFIRRAGELVRSHRPDGTVFFGDRILVTPMRADGSAGELERNSHLELESLPSGDRGSPGFPYSARYFARFDDADTVGMTSRFRKARGDCGSIRSAAALEYECLRMLAAGSRCCIADQLNPRARLEDFTYDRIGEVYRLVEDREPWCRDARLAADIGLLITGTPAAGYASAGDSNDGAASMLLQLKQQFHVLGDRVLDDRSDFSRYRLLILPDTVGLTEETARRLRDFAAGGGSLLLTHRSGLMRDGGRFGLDIGLDYEGDLPHNPDYLHFHPDFSDRLGSGMFYVMYERGSKVRPGAGAEVLATVGKPYFDRDWLRFSGPAQTPAERDTDIPGIVRRGRVFYAAHPLFASWSLHAHEPDLAVVRRALELLLPDPLVRTDLPLTAEVTVTEQDGRKVVHVLNYVPQRLARASDVVTDAQYIAGTVAIRTDAKPSRVLLVPEKQPADWEWRDGYAEVRLPLRRGHLMLSVER